jgi:amidase
MSEIWQMSAVETAKAIRDRKISASEVTAAHLERLRDVNPGVNAVTYDLSDSAFEAATAADAVARSDADLPPLHGVPITIKENVDQKGLPTPNGIPAFENLIAPDHSPLVKNLLAAGAIVIGRTNTPEFSHRYVTDNPLRGRTLNPWREDLTPGGSSGGASASVALGIGTIAHGNDLAGSLRYPAYCCGCVTIKPGLGRVPAFNPSLAQERPTMLQLFSVQGPITRTVADAKLALSIMSQESADDPWWCPVPLELEWPERMRIAVSNGSQLGTVAPEVKAAVEKAAEILRDAGHTIVEQDPPDMVEARDVYLRLMQTDASTSDAFERLGSDTLKRSGEFFYDGVPDSDLHGYIRDMAARGTIRRRWLNYFTKVDALVMPVSLRPPAQQDFDIADDAARAVRANAPMQIINLLGLPASAVPTGLADGVPMGVQIVASRFREDIALAVAEDIERVQPMLCRQLWDC